MIEKLFNRLGYTKGNKIRGSYTEEELCVMLANLTEITDDEIDKKTEEEIFSSIKKIEGFTAYLKNATMKDVQRYFGATTEDERQLIRGSFARTNYIRGKIITVGLKKEDKIIKGMRYM